MTSMPQPTLRVNPLAGIPTRDGIETPALADIVSTTADLVRRATQAHTQMSAEKERYIRSHGCGRGNASPVVLFEPRESELWLALKSCRLREALMRYLITLDLPNDSEWWLKGDTHDDEIEFVSVGLFQEFPEAFDDLVQISILSEKPIRESCLFPFVKTLVEVGIPPTPLMLKVMDLEEGVEKGKKYSYVYDGTRIEGYPTTFLASGVNRNTGEVLLRGRLTVAQPGDDGMISILQYGVQDTNDLVEVGEFTTPKYPNRELVHVSGTAHVYARDIYNVSEMGDVEAETNRKDGAGPRRVKTTVSTNGAVDLELLSEDSSHACGVLLGSVGLTLEDRFEHGASIEEIEKLHYVRTYELTLLRLITDPIEELPRPAHLPVFDFIQKRWMLASVFDFKAQQFDPEIYNSLEMDQGQKELIRDLLSVDGISIDAVEGKGNNTLMLFKGVPGSGKTLTVEAMSNHLERGLLKTAASDLGIVPEDVESRLMTWARLAQRWNVWLFIDEADVFLTRRDIKDMNRNAVVNSFLKISEYFEGTLFLTTNASTTIDQAVLSRATLVKDFYVEDLNMESLWTSLLKRGGCKKVGAGVVAKLAEYDLDGRQVKNVVENTMRLCKARGRPLSATAALETLKAMQH